MNNKISRLLLKLTILILISVGVVSCSDDTSDFTVLDQSESGYITISLKCSKSTRADYTEDDDKYNENKINSVILCLWQNDGTKPDATAIPDYVQIFTDMEATENATLRVPLNPALRQHLFETEPGECHAFAAVNVISQDIQDIDEYTSGEKTFTIEDIQNKKVSIAQLRNMAISSKFATSRIQSSFTMDGDCIVKYDASADKATGTIDNLRRSASKITLALGVDDLVEQSIVKDGQLVTSYWQPNTRGMLVQLIGGLKTSTLDPAMINPGEKGYPTKDEFFSTPIGVPEQEYKFINNQAGTDEDNNPIPDYGNNPGDMKYPFIQDVPFYSYPHVWTDEPDDYAATYMQLSIPWQQVELTKDDEGNIIERKPLGEYRTCYYQVPAIDADSEILQLVRNTSYHVYLHVGILGSFIPKEPMELDEDMEYSAAPWGTAEMDVSIPDVRYLVVDQNDYTVNNETSIVIPFYTSHETIVTDATMTFYRYNFDDAGRERPVIVTKELNKLSNDFAGSPVFTAEFDNSTKELKVSHDLKMYQAMKVGGNKDNPRDTVSFTNGDGPNVSSANRKPMTENKWKERVLDRIGYFCKVIPEQDEYSRVEFNITLQHEDLNKIGDDVNFKEVITIRQYPGMYITTISNYPIIDGSVLQGTPVQGNTIINGNVSTINNNTTSGAEDTNVSWRVPNGWMSSIGLSSTTAQNFNPNLYLVTVTTLPEDTEYKIGDPRTKEINNFLGSGTTDADGPVKTGLQETVWTGPTSYRYVYRIGNLNNNNYRTVNNVVGFTQQTAIYDPGSNGKRYLKYYYPTYENDAHKMMISPKFRICSSYGGSNWILNRELARRRAAAYQEMGYAAGRWRLPTYGEVKFIMELSATYKIPRLFGTFDATWWYWCANGLVTVPSKQSSQGPSIPGGTGYDPALVTRTWGAPDAQRARFVYDEWYWGEADLESNGLPIGSQSLRYEFTWGDKPYTPIKP